MNKLGSMLSQNPKRTRICHSYLENGLWEFLEDSTHDMVGQENVPMVPIKERCGRIDLASLAIAGSPFRPTLDSLPRVGFCFPKPLDTRPPVNILFATWHSEIE